MEELKLKDIADRITDAVLNEPHINKASLDSLILPILNIWLKKANSYKKTGITTVDKLNETIAKKHIEYRFWHRKLKEIVGSENMNPYYDEVHKELRENGYE